MAYIEREELLNNLKRFAPEHLTPLIVNLVKKQPAADVVEVKCSNWELKSRVYKMLDDVDEEVYVECPFCHRTEYVPFELEEEKMLEYARKHYPYCHCGAKMDGKDGE